MSMLFLLGILLFFLAFSITNAGEDDVLTSSYSPVIGVVVLPLLQSNSKYAYMAASYVKWLESAGARVVPLFYWTTSEEEKDHVIDDLVPQLNGIIFSGGSADLDPRSPFGAFSFLVMKKALEINLPMWGTCLGFEQLIIYSGMLRKDGKPRQEKPLENFDAQNLILPLKLLDPSYESKIVRSESGFKATKNFFDELPRKIQDSFTNLPITVNMHSRGFSLEGMEKYEMFDLWTVIGVAFDRAGSEFVAMVQMKKPHDNIIGVQFHPEKNVYEYEESYDVKPSGATGWVHSLPALRAMNELVMQWVAICRSASPYRYKRDIEKTSFYNYKPDAIGHIFEQIYHFEIPADAIFFNETHASSSYNGTTILMV